MGASRKLTPQTNGHSQTHTPESHTIYQTVD
jgi:hypothetical protein